MDFESYEKIVSFNLSNVEIVTFNELEQEIPDLLIAKGNRSKIEYYYTCSPAICYYVFQIFPYVNLITYLDSDLYFFSSPESVFNEIGSASIAIIEHKFHWLTKSNIKYGRFNVGWITFRRDNEGIRCLEEWKLNCLSWCYQKLFENKYADQKYLDVWPEKYNNLVIIKQKGANLAIWNIGNYKIIKNNDKLYIDNDELIFYHFASLKQLNLNTYSSCLSRVLVTSTSIIKQDIYYPYLYSLKYFEIYPFTSKSDTHLNSFKFFFKMISRFIRQLFFPDILHIN